METSFIREYPGVLTGLECENLITFFESALVQDNIFVSNGAQDNGGGINRSDTAIYLERVSTETNEKVFDVVRRCWEQYVTEFKFLQNTGVVSYTSKMQKTPPMGGFHSWHWEHNYAPHDISNRNRLAVWTLYLTTHEDEGETEFLAHGLKVKPEAGKFCIFPADYTAVHRGNPVYKKNKYIVTGWYEYHS